MTMWRRSDLVYERLIFLKPALVRVFAQQQCSSERKSGGKKRKKRNIQSLVWLKSSIFVTLYSAYEAYEKKGKERRMI